MLRDYDLETTAAAGANGNIYGYCHGGPSGKLVLYLPDALRIRLCFDYVIAGAHWPLGVPEPLDPMAVIRDYHRQYLFAATHPQVDIVAHPWWWMGAWKDASGIYSTYPWFDDFSRIPQSMHDELAAAAVQHGKAIEINTWACLGNPEYPPTFRAQYLDYLAYLKSRGVRFSLGTDSHAWVDPEIGYTVFPPDVADDLTAIGLTEADLWYPVRNVEVIP